MEPYQQSTQWTLRNVRERQSRHAPLPVTRQQILSQFIRTRRAPSQNSLMPWKRGFSLKKHTDTRKEVEKMENACWWRGREWFSNHHPWLFQFLKIIVWLIITIFGR